jgi:hypothetical protein
MHSFTLTFRRPGETRIGTFTERQNSTGGGMRKCEEPKKTNRTQRSQIAPRKLVEADVIKSPVPNRPLRNCFPKLALKSKTER